MRVKFIWGAFYALMVLLGPGMALSAVAHGQEPFFEVLETKRAYVGMFWVEEGQSVTFRTVTPAGSTTDPVMFLISSAGESWASDDVSGPEGLDPRISLVAGTGGRWIRVTISSYDLAYSGMTRFELAFSSGEVLSWPVWVGGTAIETQWSYQDVVTATTHYYSARASSFCVELGARWNDDLERCEDLSLNAWSCPRFGGTWSYETDSCGNFSYDDPESLAVEAQKICRFAGNSIEIDEDGQGRYSGKFVYERVNPHSGLCEYVSTAEDSLILAVRHWDKIYELCWGFFPLLCFDVGSQPDVVWADDDSGPGRNFRMTLWDSAREYSPAFVVALYPWITRWDIYEDEDYAAMADGSCSQVGKTLYEIWKPFEELGEEPGPWIDEWVDYYREFCEDEGWTFENFAVEDDGGNPVPDVLASDLLNVYRDRILTGITAVPDIDGDGLSNQLESAIGTDPTKPDSDGDGIIDSLEVYGPIYPISERMEDDSELKRYLPMTYYGASPLQKDLFVEIDTQETLDWDAQGTGMSPGQRAQALKMAYTALLDAGYHTIFVESGPNIDKIIPDEYVDELHPDWAPVDAKTLDVEDIIAPANSVYWSFDLVDYPFVRRVVWARRTPGAGSTLLTHRENLTPNHLTFTGHGRYAVTGTDKAGDVSTLLHQIGHMLGLSHAGPGQVYYRGDDLQHSHVPNYWSVMSSGVALPIHELADIGQGRTLVDDDVTLLNEETGRARPPSFSSGDAIGLDEAELYEDMGITGGDGPGRGLPETYVFKDICWTPRGLPGGPAAQYRCDEEFPVDWVDWNRDYENTIAAIAVDVEQGCEYLGLGTWLNTVRNVTGAEDICFDIHPVQNDLDYLTGLEQQAFWNDQNGQIQRLLTAPIDSNPNWPHNGYEPDGVVVHIEPD